MKKLLACAAVMLLGVIDQVQDEYALIEYESTSGELRYLHYPVDMIPCAASEGVRVQVQQMSPRRTKSMYGVVFVIRKLRFR